MSAMKSLLFLAVFIGLGFGAGAYAQTNNGQVPGIQNLPYNPADPDATIQNLPYSPSYSKWVLIRGKFEKVCQVISANLARNVAGKLVADLLGGCVTLLPGGAYKYGPYEVATADNLIGEFTLDSTIPNIFDYPSDVEDAVNWIDQNLADTASNQDQAKTSNASKLAKVLKNFSFIPEASAQPVPISVIRRMIEAIRKSGQTAAKLRAHFSEFRVATKCTEATVEIVEAGTMRLRTASGMVNATVKIGRNAAGAQTGGFSITQTGANAFTKIVCKEGAH